MPPPFPSFVCPRCGETASHGADHGVCLRCIGERVFGGVGVFGEQDREEITLGPGAPAPDAETAGQPPPDPGGTERIGPYEIIEELGRGGMGRVYAARQEGLGRIVALKVIAEGGENATDRELRFLREAETMARLRHPHIVPVYDSGREHGRLYFSMDLIDGGDLAHRLRQQAYTPRAVAGLLGKVAGALAYAHGEGVLHRDIKPSNILLEGEEPRLADFGLAVPLEAQGELTATGQFFGTPHYMAPEVLREGSKAFSVRSDVYAVGVVLFLMLTGRTPFAGVTSVAELASIVANNEPPSLRLLAPAVPPDLGTICLKCLERDPAKRYARAADLTADLRRFCNGEPIVARPVSAPVRVLRWSRRRPALAILIAALALGVVGTAWAALAINAGRARARRAEGEAREDLWHANLAHAQAARRTTAADARREALGAIADAARFRPSLALRDEAIAALCLDDVHLLRSWPLELEWTAVIAFDPTLESYVAETSPGLLVRRACANDRELGRLEVPGTKVLGIPVFSPDGRYLAARYADKTVRVWQIDTGRVAFALPGRPSPMTVGIVNYGFDLAFRPDGRQLAVGAEAGGFTLHGVPGGEEAGRWPAGVPPTILRYSPDGNQLAVVGRSVAQVQFLDARTLAVQRTVALPAVPICAAWSPAGERFAVGTRASRIHSIVADTGEIADTITVYESGGVGQIAFHPQRPILVGNGSDEAIRFWDAASGRLFMQLDSVNNRPVLAFDPAGRRFCAYDAVTRRATLAEIRSSPIYVHMASAQPLRASITTGALDASRDGRWLVFAAAGSIQLRDAHTCQPLQILPGADQDEVMSAQFTPDSRSVLVSGIGSGLRRVDIVVQEDGQPRFEAAAMIDPEPGFDIEGVSDAGRALLVSEEKQTVKIFDPANPGAGQRWPVPKITSAAFSADGRQVLTEAGEPVPGEAAVQVWDLASSPPRRTASFGDDPGGRVQCSRKGGWVLVTGDKKTELWRFGSWRHGPALPSDLQGETRHARLSADGSLLVIEKDGKLHLLATATGLPVATCEGISPAGVCVNEVFSEDGARLSLLWQYGSVHVWDLAAMHRELAAVGLDWTTGK